jgi:hypothetical protein
MARLSTRHDHIWMCWHGPSSRRILSSETILVSRQSIVCKLAIGPSRQWPIGAEAVLWVV